MNKGELIYLKMSNGDRVFLNANDIIAVLANRITMNNDDDNNNISIESQGTKLEFYIMINLISNTLLATMILMAESYKTTQKFCF